MDYASMGAGVKLMLPVNEPGALLFLGDGHARQGEGEVVGTGLETSMDVEFSVALVKKKAIGWPRLENDTHVMVLGSARPLLEAFQHATTELQKWLVADYGLTERGAQILMGQAAEYEIANVVDPNFTVVAKIRKSDAAEALMEVRAVPVNGRTYRWPAQPVVVVCLDGSAFEYIERAIAAGVAPYLRSLVGVQVLPLVESALPSFTNPNNVSIVTGVPPSVHGISRQLLSRSRHRRRR